MNRLMITGAGALLALAATAAVAQKGSTVPPTQATQGTQTASPATPTAANRALQSAARPVEATPPEVNRAEAPAVIKPAQEMTPSLARFQDLDRNNDDALSRDEAADAALALSFAQWDANADGKLNREEFAKFATDRTQMARTKEQGEKSDRY